MNVSRQMSSVEIAPFEMSPVCRIDAQYVPGDRPRMVRSNIVRFGATCTMRARPRTLSDVVVEWVSKIHTAAPGKCQY